MTDSNQPDTIDLQKAKELLKDFTEQLLGIKDYL